jgi:hypothetical protein
MGWLKRAMEACVNNLHQLEGASVISSTTDNKRGYGPQATGYGKAQVYHSFSRLKPGACRLKPLPGLAETMTETLEGRVVFLPVG